MASIRVEIRDADGRVVAYATREIPSGPWRVCAKLEGTEAVGLAVRRAESWLDGLPERHDLGA